MNTVGEWASVVNPLLGPSVHMELVSGEGVTVCRFRFDEPRDLPEHEHFQEQLTVVLQGAMALRVEEDDERVLRAGDVVVIPGGVGHAARIFETPFVSLDIFQPVREDFIAQLRSVHGPDAR